MEGDEGDEEYLALRSRIVIYSEEQPKELATPSVRKSGRVWNGIACKKHASAKLNVSHECEICITVPSEETLPNGRLPTKQVLLGYIISR